MLGLALTASLPASAATLEVCETCAYTTVSAAVEDATAADVVMVKPGSWPVALTITKPVTIRSTGGPSVTELLGTSEVAFFVATTGALEVDGFTLEPGTQRIADVAFGTATFKNVVVSNAVAPQCLLFQVRSGGTLTLDHASVEQVTAGPLCDGAVAGGVSGTLQLIDSIFTRNQADGGGVVALTDGTLSVVRSEFIDNRATGDVDAGGAIYTNATSTAPATTTISGSHFEGNTSTGYGGAISANGSAASTMIATSSFHANTTYKHGGAVAVYDGSLTVSDSGFVENLQSGDPFGTGGAIVANPGDGRSVTVTASSFVGNSALSGGAISTSAFAGAQSVAISGSLFVGNTAKASGAIWLSSYDPAITSATVTACAFLDNRAEGGSGALEGFHLPELTVQRNLFCRGEAQTNDAGAASSYEVGSLTFTNNIVRGASALRGGGLTVQTAATSTDIGAITNNDFLDNVATAPQGGGGLYLAGPGTFSVSNDYLARNTNFGLVHESGAQPTRAYLGFFENTGGNVGGQNTSVGTNAVLVDGMLADAAPTRACEAADYHPSPGSPLIDAGDPAIVDFDGTRSDIGAFGGPGAAGLDALLTDGDGDGYLAIADCDDTNAAVHLGAVEVCNGIDDDCDRIVDARDFAADAGQLYVDADLDGHGDLSSPAGSGCPSTGLAPSSDDCADLDPAMFPGALDVPDDGIDQDCDGVDAHQGDTDTAVDTDTAEPAYWLVGGGCACNGSGRGAVSWLAAVAFVVQRRRASRSVAEACSPFRNVLSSKPSRSEHRVDPR